MCRLAFHGPIFVGWLALAGSFASSAHAHLSFERAEPQTHKSRYGDDEIKNGPCGRADGERGTNVYRYRPGETITINAKEFVGHPGYFRIAFDEDGDDDFLDPRSIDPIDPNRVARGKACMDNPDDHCGASDFYNNETVLLDNLNPHLTTVIGSGKNFSWRVTLPDVECDNCTLQVIQVMEDSALHGPYAPEGMSREAIYIPDIYYQCIDLVLDRDSAPGGWPTDDNGFILCSTTAPGRDGGSLAALGVLGMGLVWRASRSRKRALRRRGPSTRGA